MCEPENADECPELPIDETFGTQYFVVDGNSFVEVPAFSDAPAMQGTFGTPVNIAFQTESADDQFGNQVAVATFADNCDPQKIQPEESSDDLLWSSDCDEILRDDDGGKKLFAGAGFATPCDGSDNDLLLRETHEFPSDETFLRRAWDEFPHEDEVDDVCWFAKETEFPLANTDIWGENLECEFAGQNANLIT